MGQRHFHDASTSERVPLLAGVIDRITRGYASTTASSAVLRTLAALLGVVAAENGHGSEMAFLVYKLARVILREP